ncbi:SRA-YDG domain protein [Cellulomonas flavigena DSM 20109]|uniref:SRA-YDG domain protein n=1 Tax=Cellulomonas flavigena (strain ATCC 482 / DSM 20109 / BCRC 11376 / JCM 18109 / NBRC 3775 / NCIMB 8073 / NRS 134) TaxID=446466 RepID=D5UBN5_CELFN|nr:SRA-YDG domain protein [Cellulomonas flavigena DSM 20109]
MSPTFGHIPGVPIGTTFENRAALAAAGVHTPHMQGISGNRENGADSIVASGSYVDDEDHGDYLIYTGMGGRDLATGRQIADQSVDQYANAGLITSELAGHPVRVVRGANGNALYAPPSGFRYDGLFTVESHWMTTGQDGYKVVQYRLQRLPNQPEPEGVAEPEDDPAYAVTVVTRRIRNTAVAQHVKEMYERTCQVCDREVSILGGLYVEGAHIRPLGRPHVGPDSVNNVLCLCPNHHVQLDYGGIVIGDDMRVTERETGSMIGPLRLKPGHNIDLAHVRYHRALWPEA